MACSTEIGQKGEGATYKFMVVQPNGKWMQEISDLIDQVRCWMPLIGGTYWLFQSGALIVLCQLSSSFI